ncbi:hypothetical protein KY290_030627 [Solanum tuberosum]|uniref:Uncharacterized protein n=1 Tax=Solanum tuberosum TaxID=4113 RepID=A0ABQ7U7T2_SOLTU|nr:hypothetical protein KY284_029645 [Solanum tuberosum]KAH0654804.1 hypothetical protein KY285_029686 [Solanum tuberosum]KAH0742634.1 hypothetical protein KY290_030627 [Solanum tuberosum]
MEKRHNYVRKTAELATQFYINPATSQPNVSGLILAGSADFKTELSQSDMFDSRLQAKILNVVDVSYGGENGFNQAIELSAEVLANVKFIQEKKLIGKYFEEISQDTGKYVFGIDDTLKVLEMGAIETLIVWENLDINRYVLKNNTSGETIIKHLNKEQDTVQSNFRDPDTNAELEVQDKLSLLEWFANEYRRFGCSLEFVTNKSQEGSQFCRGFGGIGGILRYQLDVRAFDELSDDGVEQEACTGARGLSPYSAAHVLSKKLLGDLQMDDLHEKVKYPVISSSLSDLYEDHFYFINSVPGVKQEGCIGVRGLAPDLATHVLSNKSLRTLQQRGCSVAAMQELNLRSVVVDREQGAIYMLCSPWRVKCQSYYHIIY